MQAKKIAHLAAEAALNKKAEDIQIFDLQSLSTVTDFFVICTGNTDVHVKSIFQEVDKELAEQGVDPYHTEGIELGRWILLDYVDVVVHIFQPAIREFYGLERLWGDAKIEEVKDEQVEA
ncbi:MAG: ribosome silencing factor [Deferribacteres bacterium]|nr:ribosome silencing factor [candidate division KSB1 bacterium]MCB9510971.1 ribosome silencing factor [Deferribacteres bacterium]